jgi:hypothetical protein
MLFLGIYPIKILIKLGKHITCLQWKKKNIINELLMFEKIVSWTIYK